MDKKKSNEEIDKHYFQFIHEYLYGNSKILNIKDNVISKEKKEKYYPINIQWMNEFKDYIGFKEIISQLKRRKINLIKKKDFEWIKPIIEKSRKKNYLKKKSDSNIDINKSFEWVNPSTFDLIKKSEYCGGKINNSVKSVEMKYGNEKFIFKYNENEYLITYMKNKNDKIFYEILIIFEPSDKNKKREILQDIKDSKISEWFIMIGYSENNNDNKFYFNEVFFSIKKIDKKDQKIFGNSYIDDYGNFSYSNDDSEEEEEEESEEEKEIKDLISEAESIIPNNPIIKKQNNIISDYSSQNSNNNYYFPIKIIQKIENSSYIINVMESLSRILDFSLYFLRKEIKKDKGIVFSFKDYMENILKDDAEMFSPKDFMINLKKISKEKFSLQEELDPYIYYNYILEKLNNELNGFDPEINKYFNNFSQKYKDFGELKKYSDKFIKENNSIVSKTFNGIIKIKKNCDLCGKNEEIEYINFNIIDIDIYEFCNDMHLKGNSLTNFYLDDCIEYYFDDRQKTNELYNCPDCKNKAKKKIQRKIVELPDYLILRINWGNFKNAEGFKFKLDHIKPSYQYLDVNETIEISEDYLNDIAFNKDNRIKESVQYKLFSTIDYFKDKNIFISKNRIKDEGKRNKWYIFWCNNIGIEKLTYFDNFTTPCLLFYEKIKISQI